MLSMRQSYFSEQPYINRETNGGGDICLDDDKPETSLSLLTFAIL